MLSILLAMLVNPRRACTGGLRYLSCVSVCMYNVCMCVLCVCVCVCVCVCLSVCYNSSVNIVRFYMPSKVCTAFI